MWMQKTPKRKMISINKTTKRKKIIAKEVDYLPQK